MLNKDIIFSLSSNVQLRKLSCFCYFCILVKPSTSEIAKFAQTISPDSEMEAMERHGQSPELISCKSHAKELEHIRQRIFEFNQSGHYSLGIVCKTQKQAKQWHHQLIAEFPEAVLLTEDSAAFSIGLVVCSAHMSKGLEFDVVVVPDADSKNYHEPSDRNLLYIACTRAMHKL